MGPPFRQSVRFASTLFCRRGPYTGLEQEAEGARGHDPWGNLSSLQHGTLRLRLPAGRQAGGTASSPPFPMDAGGGAGRCRRNMRPFSPFSPVAFASARRGRSLLRTFRMAGLPALSGDHPVRSPALRRNAERPAAVGPARSGVGSYGGPLLAAVLAGGTVALVHDGGAAGGADRGRAQRAAARHGGYGQSSAGPDHRPAGVGGAFSSRAGAAAGDRPLGAQPCSAAER